MTKISRSSNENYHSDFKCSFIYILKILGDLLFLDIFWPKQAKGQVGKIELGKIPLQFQNWQGKTYLMAGFANLNHEHVTTFCHGKQNWTLFDNLTGNMKTVSNELKVSPVLLCYYKSKS